MADQTPSPMVGQLAAVLEQLTDEQIETARATIETHGWPAEVEGVSIDVILERCREDRDLLAAGCGSGYLNSRPTTTVAQIRDHVKAALDHVLAVAQGSNVVGNLASVCNTLRAFIITNRLDRGDERFAALEKELAATHELKAEVTRRSRALTAAVDKIPQLEDLLKRSKDAVGEIDQHRIAAHDQQQVAAGSAQQAAEALKVANQHKDAAATALAQAESSRNAVLAYEEDLKKLHGDGVEFRKTMVDVQRRAEDGMEENRAEYEKAFALAREHQEATQKILEGAVSGDLFEAFDQRYRELERTKWRWFWALAVGVVLFAGVSIWILTAAFPFSTAFYGRLLLVPTFGFWVGFAAIQYGRERHLEEVYAFKSKISVSLEACRGLVARVLATMENIPDNDPRKKYAEFVIDSVTKIFTPPPDHVENEQIAGGVLGPTVEMVERFCEAIRKSGQ